MTENDVRKIIKDELKKSLNIVLFAASANSNGDAEDVKSLFPGMDPLQQRPIASTFGLVSSAPNDTVSVVVRIGDHPGNRLVIGHRDPNKPNFLSRGESCLYNSNGQKVYLKNGCILIGSENANEPLVLGNVMKDFLDEFLQEMLDFIALLKNGPLTITTTPGNPSPTYPTLVTALELLVQRIEATKTTFISTPASNILSQENFTERSQ